MRNKPAWRKKLQLLLLGSAVALAASAAAQTADYQEAPQWAQQVEAGQLPPVDERLPNNPKVVEPNDRIGSYGGTWHTALTGPGDLPWLGRIVGYENLVRVNVDWTGIEPNIAESYEVNEDATEYTFHLREGMRWSDGEPFTADDILFWYEDVFMNDQLQPVRPDWLAAGGEPVVAEKLDDYTVVFRFAAPNGFFLQRLASSSGHAMTSHPRHYLSQFHVDHNPEGIDALVREAGAADWSELFLSRGAVIVGTPDSNRWQNPELPMLLPWLPTTALGEATTRFTVERNPYYWKVDPEGQQLPYLDRVIFEMIADTEVMLLRAAAGDFDMHSRHINTVANMPVLFDNQERGNYRFYDLIPSDDSVMTIAFNMTHNDPVKREIFQNKDFRIGLSHAIDRQELIDTVWVGIGEIWQPAPRPQVPFYSERLAKQYTEFDLELANEHLDRAGYSERDAQGYRLGPDGNRISFVVEMFPRQDWSDMLELIQGYWQDVGIDMQIRSMDRSLFQTRVQANEHDVAIWFGGAGLMDAMLDMRWYFPAWWEAMFAPLWSEWYTTNGTQGEEPPAAARRQMELYDQLRATADEAGQTELMRQILEITADEFYAMGILLPPNRYGIVKNNFHNVPASMFDTGSAYFQPGPSNPEQYFIEAP